MSKVIVISTSLRAKSNSDILTDHCSAAESQIRERQTERIQRKMKHISLERLWNKGRKIGVILFVLVMLVSVTACGQTETTKESPAGSQETAPVTITASEDAETVNAAGEVTTESEVSEKEIVQDNEPEQEADTMILKINGEPVSVEWEDNESVEALMDLVSKEPLSIRMSMYGGFEQVGSIGMSLPRNDVQTTTEAGDIVLYSGDQIVIFYGSNSWAYTRLGRITDKNVDELAKMLGKEDVTISIDSE